MSTEHRDLRLGGTYSLDRRANAAAPAPVRRGRAAAAAAAAWRRGQPAASSSAPSGIGG
jgi:hypothetical protein